MIRQRGYALWGEDYIYLVGAIDEIGALAREFAA
jgi:hypothetical protein